VSITKLCVCVPNKDVAVLIYFCGVGFSDPSTYPDFGGLKGFVCNGLWVEFTKKTSQKTFLEELLLPITYPTFLGSRKAPNQPITLLLAFVLVYFASRTWSKAPLC